MVRFAARLRHMEEHADRARIYLLDDDERHVSPGGPAVIGPGGAREDLPDAVFAAVKHVIDAMRAGMGVKISPLRAELPVDEAAHAIAMSTDDFRAHVAGGEVPFRSTRHVDWVRLADVVAFDRRRKEQRKAAIEEILDQEPWDESDENGTRG